MNGELLNANDVVIASIPAEHREYGNNAYPDGTIARLVRFHEIYHGRLNQCGLAPGVYLNRFYADIVLPDGTEHVAHTAHLVLADQVELSRRESELKSHAADRNFVRPLPETPFWEGDIVRVTGSTRFVVVVAQFPMNQRDVFVVSNIDYSNLSTITNGIRYPVYSISDKIPAEWFCFAGEGQMELLERGNVWKFYHDEPLTFADLKEEATFHRLIGQVSEVRNPNSNRYSWTLDDALAAIRSGIAHGISIGTGLFSGQSVTRLYLYNDETVGKKVAEATLAGFQ